MSQRWRPRLPLAVIGGRRESEWKAAVAVITTLIEPSLSDFTFFLFIVPSLPGVAFLVWRRGNRLRHPEPLLPSHQTNGSDG